MEKTLTFSIDPSTLDFELPPRLIAQEPLLKRDEAKLLVLDPRSGDISHHQFYEVIKYFNRGDVLVLNQAKVNHARLRGHKKTGGAVEVLLIAPEGGASRWKALVKPMLKVGTEIFWGSEAKAQLVGWTERGENILEFSGGDPISLMDTEGEIPLPPYIKRSKDDPRLASDRLYYQTVYAKNSGSIAAPTAGLHFTEDLLAQLKQAGVQILTIVLHVGWGTFRPISSSVDRHQMLPEKYEITADVWKDLKLAKQEGRRIVAVGTTVTRVLESLTGNETEAELSGETSIFIKPGFQFKWIDRLITNMHVPRSTPLSLVSALAGLEKIEKSYDAAIQHQYRFFSYGDAMMIL